MLELSGPLFDGLYEFKKRALPARPGAVLSRSTDERQQA